MYTILNVAVVSTLYTSTHKDIVIFTGTIRCQLMCDQFEEAAQQLAFFCEAQESLGNMAVKS